MSGLLVDKTNNYGTAFYFCAAGMALSAVFLGLVRPAKRGLLCKCRTPQQAQDTRHWKEDTGEPTAEQIPEGRTDEHAADSLVNKQPGSTDADGVISFA